MAGTWEVRLNGEKLRERDYEALDLPDLIWEMLDKFKDGDVLEIKCISTKYYPEQLGDGVEGVR